MAAVEKRKNIFVAVLINHLMLAVIAGFIVMPLSGVAKMIFGIIMSLLYYMGLYDFSLREAVYHKRPYTPMEASYKYAAFYGLISSAYVWLPIIGLLIYDCIGTRLFYLVFDSFFTFTPLYQLGENICKFSPVAALIITALNFGFCFLGYYLGLRDNSIAKIINKYVYGGKKREPRKKR